MLINTQFIIEVKLPLLKQSSGNMVPTCSFRWAQEMKLATSFMSFRWSQMWLSQSIKLHRDGIHHLPQLGPTLRSANGGKSLVDNESSS